MKYIFGVLALIFAFLLHLSNDNMTVISFATATIICVLGMIYLELRDLINKKL